MWFYRRLFASVIACGLLFGSVFFLRLQLGDRSKPLAPELLPNVARFRPARVCSSRALVLVTSSPENALRRQVIRDTWAHPSVTQSLDISVAFGVGPSGSVDAQRSVDWEAEIYGDIFQDESDGPPKVLRLLRSARGACSPLPEFVLKTEDAVFVNIYSLAEMIENLETDSSSNTMWCLEWNRYLDRVGGNATWVVPRSSNASASPPQRPSHCLGALYLMTGRALDALLKRHDSRPGLLQYPEDVYVTGSLARETRLTLSPLGERMGFEPRSEELDPSKVAFAYLDQSVEEETRKLWKAFVKATPDDGRRADIGL